MDDYDDIFGHDVRDTSHLQIVSSDEEDFSSKTPENTRSRNSQGLFSISNKPETVEERFDRHYRLDKSLRSDISDDAQIIIDELNKIFDQSEQVDKPENEPAKEDKQENLISKGINIINTIKSSLVHGSKEPTKEVEGANNSNSKNLRFTSRTKRTRACTGTNLNNDPNLNDLFSSSSSESALGNDEEYDPTDPSGLNLKKPRKNTSTTKKSPKKSNTPTKSKKPDSSILNRFDKFGFDNFPTPEEPDPFDNQSFQRAQDNLTDTFCLKFAVVDQNKKVINDPRLDTVYVKTSETLGNIAKKLGEMYGLDQENFVKIKIIIDGDPQDHNIQIGDPQLCIENNMQIDIKFPPKEDFKASGTSRKNKHTEKTKKTNKPKPSVANTNQNCHSSNPIEIIEIVEID